MTATIQYYPSFTAFINGQNRVEKLKGESMKNEMGHFLNWQFGVPVKVYAREQKYQHAVAGEKGRLVSETETHFRFFSDDGMFLHYNKQDFYYELIPYKYTCFSPRYPVCESLNRTTFCNATSKMDCFAVADRGQLQPYTNNATLNIEGRIIELSAETIAELKKKLRM